MPYRGRDGVDDMFGPPHGLEARLYPLHQCVHASVLVIDLSASIMLWIIY